MKQIRKSAVHAMCFFGFFFLHSIGVHGIVGQDTFSINVLGHASLFFEYKELVIHVDPYSQQANYTQLPDADLIYITHGHSDHFDLTAINNIKKDSTLLICTQAVKNIGSYSGQSTIMNNGDSLTVKGIPTKAVAAYNLTAAQHPKGTGNGYIITLGEKRVYIAGDTENIPEMKNLGKIDIAFLPMNLPYTMSPAMAAEAARIIKPDILYIYHFGNSDTALLRSLLVNEKMIIRIGKSVSYESDKREITTQNQKEINSKKLPLIFPNPVCDYLSISNLGNISTFSIYDLKGKRLFQKLLTTNEDQKFDLRHFKRGIYVMKLTSKEINKSTIILKE